MRSALLAWQEEAAGQARARREAERLRVVADYVRLARCWREWRSRVDGARRLCELLQRARAHLVCLREAQVCRAEIMDETLRESGSMLICRGKVLIVWPNNLQR